MKVYLELPVNDRGLKRVRDALVKYAPKEVQVVSSIEEAEMVIIHVWGRQETTARLIEKLQAAGKKYAMIQYVLRSSMRPDTHDWIDMWQGSKVVWSYYYLPELCFEDGLIANSLPFYYAPLGVDQDVFYDRNTKPGHKACVIATCSKHALSESVRECVIAAKALDRKVFHLGGELRRGTDVFCKSDISDEELAYYYSCCEFVSGLRRVEGFELPAVEGLLCGARPILFDKPHFRAWYEGLATFIPEGSREDVIEELKTVFSRGARSVTEAQLAEAKKRFYWPSIMSGFYDRLLA